MGEAPPTDTAAPSKGRLRPLLYGLLAVMLVLLLVVVVANRRVGRRMGEGEPTPPFPGGDSPGVIHIDTRGE